MTDRDCVAFMRDLEERFKERSGLPSRAYYKIFYGPVRPAPILLLGINPGGDPSNTDPDGVRHRTGEVAASSAGYYEGGEHDILDCDWQENKGLKKLLVPLLNGDEEAIRSTVVKTNLAFRRSPKATDIDRKDIEEAAPFLAEIVAVVGPQLVILTGIDLMAFVNEFCVNARRHTEQVKDLDIKHVVFESAHAQLKNCGAEAFIVRVAHASQFSWTYAKYGVVERIKGTLAQVAAPSPTITSLS
jgi:hypothetical protein